MIWLRIATGRRRTSWLLTSVAEDLNSGLPRTNLGPPDYKSSVLTVPSRCHQVADHYKFLGNCPPTPPLNQHFALSEK